MGGERFTALDSWRGIAASMVVLYHVRVPSHVSDLEIVNNAYLFVDFFFVLSGFVIAATYEERLAGGFSLWRFMLLRFGRIYPLHLAMLVTYVGYELLSSSGRPGGPGIAPAAMGAAFAHLLLIHGIGIFDNQFWNTPSWTISTEFFTYLAFALAVASIGARIKLVLAAIVLVFPLLLYAGPGNLEAPGYEMMRCMYGFAVGMTTWHVFRRFRGNLPTGTLAEALSIVVVIAFISCSGGTGWSIGAPLVFGGVVLVFAAQHGLASRVLGTGPFLFLGLVSYSIYMVHMFLARRMAEAMGLAKAAGIRAVDHIGIDKWAGDLTILLFFAILLTVCAATCRFIEVPARRWFKRLAYRSRPSLPAVASAPALRE